MNNPIFGPVVVLVIWSLIMLIWMSAVRIKAMQGVDTALTRKPGTRGQELESVLPPKAQWPSHNYNHLMEQPTLFYALAVVLALSGGGSGIDLYLAWAYTVFRIIHSLVQSTTNIVPYRFGVFILATLALIGMAVRAVMLVWPAAGA